MVEVPVEETVVVELVPSTGQENRIILRPRNLALVQHVPMDLVLTAVLYKWLEFLYLRLYPFGHLI